MIDPLGVDWPELGLVKPKTTQAPHCIVRAKTVCPTVTPTLLPTIARAPSWVADNPGANINNHKKASDSKPILNMKYNTTKKFQVMEPENKGNLTEHKDNSWEHCKKREDNTTIETDLKDYKEF